MSSNLSVLFQPVTIGSLSLSNRIVMAPMTRMFAQDGVLLPSAVDYYRRRAEGGTGLILTEGVATSRIGAQTANVPHMLSNEARQAWREVVAAVHGSGGRIMAQLWHTGLGRIQPAGFDPEMLSVGPCAEYLPESSPLIATGGNHPVGRDLTLDEIDATIIEFGDAAAAAQDLGFDGVQLHGAHGYLIDQFLWAETNRRTDGYGGDQAQRTRFAVEVIEKIRARTGSDFPLSFRFSQWKLPSHYQVQPLATPDDLAAILMPLADAGIDFFDASARRYWDPAFPGSPLNLAAWAKKITGVPVMTVGSVGLSKPLDTTMQEGFAECTANLEPLAALVERGDIDLVGVGRALIANPDWPARVSGGADELAPFRAELLQKHY